jgi:hypothetical protein
MRPWPALLVFLGILALCSTPASAQRGDVYDIGVFFNPLSPYGEWIELPPYGWVWSPYDLAPDWRPYTVGRWVWTDWGWTWVSFEPWGWATYHYGRWYFDPWYGWVWVPGTEWAPAWVAWRYGGGWIGWSPLPPAFTCRPGVGFSNPTVLGPQVFRRFAWCFVEVTQFCRPNIRPYIARPVRNVNILNLTRDVTRYDYQSGGWFNRGVDVRTIEQRTRTTLPTYRVIGTDRMFGGKGVDLGARDLRIYRPKIGDSKVKTIIPPPRPAGQPASLAPDVLARQEAERRALEQRLAAERLALEDRQRREAERLRKQLSADDFRKWQSREREAYEDMSQRERNLLQRYHDREKSGKAGLGQPQGRKFNLGPLVISTTQPAGRR